MALALLACGSVGRAQTVLSPAPAARKVAPGSTPAPAGKIESSAPAKTPRLLTASALPEENEGQKNAPLFTLKDVDGKTRSLEAWRGKSVLLFVFCGCKECKPVAEWWAKEQKVRRAAKGAKLPLTVIAYIGSVKETRAFGEQIGFDSESTLLLPDPTLVVASKYEAMPCPRVFAIDEAGRIRYTNPKTEKAAPLAPETLVSRSLASLAPLPKPLVVSPPMKPVISPSLNAAPKPKLFLTALSAEGLAVTEAARAQFAIKGVDAEATPRLMKIFSFRNDTGQPIPIERVQTSCGCESVLLSQAGKEVARPTLAPGETLDVKLSVNIAHHPGGSKTALAWIYSPASSAAVGTMEIQAEILPQKTSVPSLSAAPAQISLSSAGLKSLTGKLFFGAVSKGTAVTRRLILSAPNLKDLNDLKGENLPAWITLHPGKPFLANSGQAALFVEVELASSAPEGVLRATLKLTVSGGKVETPLVGSVEAPALRVK